MYRYITLAFDCVATSVSHFVSFEMRTIDAPCRICFFANLGQRALIAVVRMKFVIYVAPEVSAAMEPWAGADKETLRRALEELPEMFRETLVLREMEGMSYREIADVTSVSLGTVMSRLARARTRLRQSLSVELSRGH